MSIAVVVISLILRWYLGYLNDKKKRVQYLEESSASRQQSLEEIGDTHPGTAPSPYSTFWLCYLADHDNRFLLYDMRGMSYSAR